MIHVFSILQGTGVRRKIQPRLLGRPDTYYNNCVVLASFLPPDKRDIYIGADGHIYDYRRTR
jgi:hypothetical protein